MLSNNVKDLLDSNSGAIVLPFSDSDCQILIENVSRAFQAHCLVEYSAAKFKVLELAVDEWLPEFAGDLALLDKSELGNPFVRSDPETGDLVYNKTLDDDLLKKQNLLYMLLEAVRYFTKRGFAPLQVNIVIGVLMQLHRQVFALQASNYGVKESLISMLRTKLLPALTASPVRVLYASSKPQLQAVAAASAEQRLSAKANPKSSKGPKAASKVPANPVPLVSEQTEVAENSEALAAVFKCAFSSFEIGELLDYISATFLQHEKLLSQVYGASRPIDLTSIALDVPRPGSAIAKFPLKNAISDAAFKEIQEQQQKEKLRIEHEKLKQQETANRLQEHHRQTLEYLALQAAAIETFSQQLLAQNLSSVLPSSAVPTSAAANNAAATGNHTKGSPDKGRNASKNISKPPAPEEPAPDKPLQPEIDQVTGLPKPVIEGLMSLINFTAPVSGAKPATEDEIPELSKQHLSKELEKCFVNLQTHFELLTSSRFGAIQAKIQEIDDSLSKKEQIRAKLIVGDSINSDGGDGTENKAPLTSSSKAKAAAKAKK